MDIATVFDPIANRFDWQVVGGQLAVDDGLETAIIISLFTDRQADPDDVLPDDAVGPFGTGTKGSGDTRGWCGDWITTGALGVADGDALPTPPDLIGSRLWLLHREKELPIVLTKARDYAAEALDWMKTLSIVREVDVTTEISRPGVLGLLVQLTRLDGSIANFRYDHAWGAST